MGFSESTVSSPRNSGKRFEWSWDWDERKQKERGIERPSQWQPVATEEVSISKLRTSHTPYRLRTEWKLHLSRLRRLILTHRRSKNCECDIDNRSTGLPFAFWSFSDFTCPLNPFDLLRWKRYKGFYVHVLCLYSLLRTGKELLSPHSASLTTVRSSQGA